MLWMKEGGGGGAELVQSGEHKEQDWEQLL